MALPLQELTLLDFNEEERVIPECGNPALCYCFDCTSDRASKLILTCTPPKCDPRPINFPYSYALYLEQWMLIHPYSPCEMATAVIIQYLYPCTSMQYTLEYINCNMVVHPDKINESVLTYWHYPSLIGDTVNLTIYMYLQRIDLYEILEGLQAEHLNQVIMNPQTGGVVPNPDHELARKFSFLKNQVYSSVNGVYCNRYFYFDPKLVQTETFNVKFPARNAVENVMGGSWTTYWSTVEKVKRYVYGAPEDLYFVDENEL